MATAEGFGRRQSVEEDVAAVVVLLSRSLGAHSDAQLSRVGMYVRALAAYAHTPVNYRGALLPEPAPEVPTLGDSRLHRAAVHPGAEAVLRAWETAEMCHGVDARLPRAVLEAYFRPELWPAALALLGDGPLVAGERGAAMLRLLSQRRTAGTRARPAGSPISSGALGNYQTALWRLMQTAVDLRAGGHEHPLFGSWLAAPRKRRVPGREARTDRSGPSRTHIRLVWQYQRAEVLRRLRCNEESLLERIGALNASQLRSIAVYRHLRNWVLLSLLITIGPRRHATVRLSRRDYVTARRRRDGSVGPALRHEPWKSWQRGEPSWKPLPPGLARLVEALILCVEHMLGRPPARA